MPRVECRLLKTAAKEWVHDHLLHDFHTKLEKLVGTQRYKHLLQVLDEPPMGAPEHSLEKRWSSGEGKYRRAMIYGM